ncbi:hypothetical protein C7444_12417 [Sphaerotilus hippei]|uniref:Uncharacterized protein n=1 Tax=Sphaerotilus hippei TaxID=744406 RepID=A0A318GW09_9BURK|nr:hypothetical protein [Sphaerotilus hippei]PXW92408.1 hypothetical protein C7444_12417 [Sphaerotilus hippei]
MEPITEGTLQLTFNPGWHAIQFDKTPWYAVSHLNAHGVMAMDVTARGPDGHHWWIEIKDCVGYEADNLPRLAIDPPSEVKATQTWANEQGWKGRVEAKRAKMFVADEVLQKVVGTVATLTAAARAPVTDAHAAAVRPFVAACMTGSRWNVVLLLTWNIPDYGRLASRLKTALEQRLRAFDVTCHVVNENITAPTLPWTVGRVTP